MSRKSYLSEKSQVSIAPDLAFWFPYRFFIHVRDGKYLVIAPEKPAWLTLDKTEHAFFQYLLAGKTIRQAIRLVMTDLGTSLIETVDAAYAVLNKIEEHNLLEKKDAEEAISRQIMLRLSSRDIPFPYPRINTPPGSFLSLEHIRGLFSAMRAQRPHDAVYKLRYLGWATGGDPGLLPIMEEANRFGLKNVLATGRMSALEDRILALADLVEIHVNDNHNMKKPSKGIRKLFKSHSRLVFRVFLTVDNVGTLPLELFKFLDAVDPDRLVPVRVSIFHSSRTIMLPEEGVSEKGLHDAAREIRSMLFDQGRLLFRADPRFYSGHCCEFGRDLSIDPAGGVYVCPYSRKPFWSLGSDSPSSVLKESLELHRQAMVTSLEECGSCDLQNICRGRCRLPYLKDGSIDRTMTCCSPAFREHIYDRMLDNDSIYY